MKPLDTIAFVSNEKSYSPLLSRGARPLRSEQLSDPQDWLEQYGDYLFRCAVLRVREQTVAEELVQETFLAALQAKERFAGKSTERSWLVGILKHKIVDHFRKSSREQTGLERDVSEEGLPQLFDDIGHWKDDSSGPKEWINPAAAVDRKEFWEAMKYCLSQLPSRTATVFAMREIDEMSSEEVCMTLNITKANLWVMLHRARSQLRHCMEINYMGNSN